MWAQFDPWVAAHEYAPLAKELLGLLSLPRCPGRRQSLTDAVRMNGSRRPIVTEKRGMML